MFGKLLLGLALLQAPTTPPLAPKPMTTTPAASAPSFFRTYAETKGFMRGRPAAPQITPDGKHVLFLESEARTSRLELFQFEVATGKSEVLITPQEVLGGAEEKLSVEEKARRERMRMTETGFTQFSLSADGRFVVVPLGGKVHLVERATKKVLTAETGKGAVLDPKLSPAGDRLAYVKDGELFVTDLAKRKELQLTKGASADLLHGVAEFVAQEELDRMTGFWWSPDGKWLVYAEVDQREVEKFTISDPSHPERSGDAFAYPRPGKANAKVRLGVIPSGGGKTTWLAWDTAKHPYLAWAAWPKDGPFVMHVLSRDQRDEAFLLADAKALAGGPLATLHASHDDAWLNADAGSRLIVGKQLVRLDDSSGKTRVVVHALAANAPGRELPFEGARDLMGGDEKGLFVKGSVDPTDSPIWRVPLDGSPAVKVTAELGEHQPAFASGSEAFVDTFLDEKHLPVTRVLAADGKVLGTLPARTEEPPFQPNVEFTTVEKDGRTFHAAIVRPRDFDARRKYPVIDAVYGGPHFNVVTREANRLLAEQAIADRGFVVVKVDGRGTPRRDRAWERAIHKDFASPVLEDHVAALTALGAKFKELDLERIGIQGWSFGGYFSALAVLKRPDIFKVGVAGAPVVDWADYDTAYTERYLETPQTNAAGYAASGLLAHATKLERPLLLIHGTADDNVYFFHSLKLVDALVRHGARPDFLPLPGQTHILAEPAIRERVFEMQLDYLAKALIPPTKTLGR